MKKAHDYLWSKDTATWHYWTERRFRAHCEGWSYITYAGGASTAKSYDAAKIALIFWLANPQHRTVVIASTTLESLGARIWGYVTKALNAMEVKLPFQYMGGQSPKILYPSDKKVGGKIKDTIHGMFAVAAKSGDAEKSISTWIGRHPDEALMLVLDESTEINAGIKDSFANLEAGGKPFQCYGIGNSLSIFDLHGAMSTPKDGWDSVDPLKDNKWETTQKNGLCLFFSCYESPAIFEPDEAKKKRLSKFLITEEQINEKKLTYGEDSDSFWRFVLGYWKTASSESVVVSKEFLEEFQVDRSAEWTGFYPLYAVAGLDPAFSTGGDECILRIAILGVDHSGKIVLDFKYNKLVFKIDIKRSVDDSADIQVAKQVEAILRRYNIPLSHLAIDATGQGRSLGEVIKLYMREIKPPIKIYSTKQAVGLNSKTAKSFDVLVKSSYELWHTLREFVQTEQVRGLDNTTIHQLSSRLVETRGGKNTLESKYDYKKRMGAVSPLLAKSPDYADAAALALQSAIINYGFTPGQTRAMPSLNSQGFDMKLFINNKERIEESVKKPSSPPIPLINFDGGYRKSLKLF